MTDPSSQRRSGPSGSSRRDYPDRSVLGGEIGIWSSDLNRVAAPQAIEAAVEIEELGYAALWFGEALGREAFTNASLLLCATSQLVVSHWHRQHLRPRRLGCQRRGQDSSRGVS